jgi:hypothetical protein
VPPFVVATMTAPGPTEEEPTAMQSMRLAQEIPVKFVTVAGIDSLLHVVPPFVVPKLLPAKQVDSLTHETPVRTPTFDGTGWLDQTTPASVVLMMTGVEKMPKPTAVHVDGKTHEMPVRPLTSAGIDWPFQVRPTLVECKTASIPTAKQSVVVGHEAEASWLVPIGGVWFDQDNPPVVVARIVDPEPVFPLLPTVMQSFESAQEMLVRSTALDGTVWLAHVAPLLSVPIT